MAALLLATAPSALMRSFEAMEYRSTVHTLLTELKQARLHAMHSGQSTTFVYDPRARRFGIDTPLRAQVPAALRITLIVADAEITHEHAAIRFYPDGGASGGAIELVRPSGDGVRIRVDWLLGRTEQSPITRKHTRHAPRLPDAGYLPPVTHVLGLPSPQEAA
jgi:general secretion pathway protein H